MVGMWIPLTFSHSVLQCKKPITKMGNESHDQDATEGPGMGEPACPVHCLYSSSSTLMTLVGMEGRGCCSTSEPNHLARPTGELLLWLVRCSSWECIWGRPDRLGTFWGVWTLIAAAWELEPGGCRTERCSCCCITAKCRGVPGRGFRRGWLAAETKGYKGWPRSGPDSPCKGAMSIPGGSTPDGEKEETSELC